MAAAQQPIEVPLPLEIPDREPSPQTDGADDDLYADQENAQALIQPQISPIATRITSPLTLAAEKAAILDLIPAEDESDGTQSSFPGLQPHVPERTPVSRALSSRRDRVQSMIDAPSTQLQTYPLPTPWTSGPKEFSVDNAQEGRPALAGVFGQPRSRRSTSVGHEALRRLSKAFPSMSLSGNLLSNISTPSFFSSTLSKSDSASATPTRNSPEHTPQLGVVTYRKKAPAPISITPPVQQDAVTHSDLTRPRSIASRKSLALRKSTSNDSLLYHSLSRVSSFGDDDRFLNQRDQVNSRFKAIKDSWDPPFKLPQLPNILPSPMKKAQFSPEEVGFETPRSSSFKVNTRTSRDVSSPLDNILDSLTGDIVIMGGYRGSILRSAEPPHRQLWVPVKVGLNIRKVNLEVGLDPEDEENMEKTIFPSGMLQNIGPVDIAKRLFKKLRESDNAKSGKLRVHDYGYDWRLSPHLLSRKLIEFLEKLPSNQSTTAPEKRGALVIAHSLGGLLTRHAVNKRPELFSGVVYAGSPQRCVNILGPLRNGDAVLLNEKVLTAQVNFSLRTTFVFLPEDGYCFIDKFTGEEYPVDFYDINDWIKYRWCPCVGEPALPPFLNRSGSLGSFLNRSSSLSLRSRSGSDPKKVQSPTGNPIAEAARMVTKDRTLAPQMDSSAAADSRSQGAAASSLMPKTVHRRVSDPQAKAIEYLTRTLAETKQFRAETAHNPAHTEANIYPPLAVIYGKDIPTLSAARVAGRDAIACADAYDDLAFRSGDGVVLAREAMLPPGYELVNGGRVSTDRGHVTMLGDLPAVGRALEAVVRGRRKGIGMGQHGKRRAS